MNFSNRAAPWGEAAEENSLSPDRPGGRWKLRIYRRIRVDVAFAKITQPVSVS